MSDKNASSKFSRRCMLRAAVGATLVGQTAMENGAAVERKTLTVTQNGSQYEITPLTYEDSDGNKLTINEFYNYYSASAHPPADANVLKGDTSRIFLYEGPNELSLVIIHDKPYSDDGSYSKRETAYNYQGLPESGSWDIQDDEDGANEYESYSRKRTKWRWNYKNTDGGAFRDVRDKEFTISPDVQGNSEFELLSGSAENPEVYQLELFEPVQFSQDVALSEVVNEKLNLANHIDELDTFGNINEYDRVSTNMNVIQSEVDSGNYQKSDAIDVISRMKYSENIAEHAILLLGPAESTTSEDESTLIGVSNSSYVSNNINLGKQMSRDIIAFCVPFLLEARIVSRSGGRAVDEVGRGDRFGDEVRQIIVKESISNAHQEGGDSEGLLDKAYDGTVTVVQETYDFISEEESAKKILSKLLISCLIKLLIIRVMPV